MRETIADKKKITQLKPIKYQELKNNRKIT